MMGAGGEGASVVPTQSSAVSRVRPLAAVVAVVLLAVAALLAPAGAHGQVEPTEPPGARAIKGPTWGTPARAPEASFTRSGPIHPDTVAEAHVDQPRHYAEGCHVEHAGTVPIGCVYGAPRGTVDVAVLGDSKVGQWFPALEAIAQREGWRLTVYTKSGCSYVPTRTHWPTYAACDTYNDAVQALLRADPPDYVITSGQYRSTPDAYVEEWRDLRNRGVKRIVALWDSPAPSQKVPECLEPLVPGGDYLASCSWTFHPTSGSPTLEAATHRVGGTAYVDMSDWVCPPSTRGDCPPVIGGVMVYAKGTHLTDTYVGTLTDALHQRLARAGVATRPPDPERVQRTGGRDRYETAALLAEGHAPGGPVLVTTGATWPDAVSAAARAGSVGAPVLLTRQGDLPAATREALGRLRPSSITVVGGSGVVSEAVLSALRGYTSGSVTRVAGPDRYATSAAVARLAGTDVPMVYVATGTNYPDALAAAARAGHEDAPVLLTRTDSLPADVASALTALRPRAVTVMGQTDVLGAAVADRIRDLTGAPVTRVAGPDRYATAAVLTQRYPAAVDRVYVATGSDFPDALAAAARAGHEAAPLVLVRKDAVPAATATALRRLAPAGIVTIGSTVVLSDGVRWGLERYLR